MERDEEIECLRRELHITRQQLCLAQSESAHYQRLLLEEEEEDERKGEMPHRIKACDVSRSKSCAGGNVMYKFVPPLEFLPAVFVAEYRDVIEIIEKYAQLYHRFARVTEGSDAFA